MINGMLQIVDWTITLNLWRQPTHQLEIFARIFNKALHCIARLRERGGGRVKLHHWTGRLWLWIVNFSTNAQLEFSHKLGTPVDWPLRQETTTHQTFQNWLSDKSVRSAETRIRERNLLTSFWESDKGNIYIRFLEIFNGGINIIWF